MRGPDEIAGKRIGDRQVAVEHLARLTDVDRCQMLFVGESKRHDLPAVVAYLGDRPILTVADKPGFTRAKGIIGINTVAGKLRFRINLNAAERAGLRFSSKLLRLARSKLFAPPSPDLATQKVQSTKKIGSSTFQVESRGEFSAERDDDLSGVGRHQPRRQSFAGRPNSCKDWPYGHRLRRLRS
ncbi:MAG: YfiR family protein [Alphaproteobacteria bacterium]|nr:YfiR family protein [Alphaproteobacteria bacterium]